MWKLNLNVAWSLRRRVRDVLDAVASRIFSSTQAGGDLGKVEGLDDYRFFKQTGNIVAARGFGGPEVVPVLVGPPDAHGVRPTYRTTEQGHDRALVQAASTLARDQSDEEADPRDALYAGLSDQQLADLWRDKRNPGRKAKLPNGALTSRGQKDGIDCFTYDRSVLLRWLKMKGIVPDAP